MVLEIHEKSPYQCLTNECVTPIKTHDGLTFNTVAHAYYYYMSEGDDYTRNIIRSTPSLEKIKGALGFEKYSILCKLSRHIRKYSIIDTIELMKTLLLTKLNSHPHCVDILMATSGRKLVVLCGSDNVLGSGKARMGTNLTGLILMELRDSFQKKRQRDYLNSLITNYKVIDKTYYPEKKNNEQICVNSLASSTKRVVFST